MNILAKLRAESGLTVDKLAQSAQISTKTVYNLENGLTTARLDVLNKLSAVFKVPVETLAPLREQGRNKPKNAA